jgi:hypothetical protein
LSLIDFFYFGLHRIRRYTMSFKNLPNSLVDSVSEIMSKSVQEDTKLVNDVVSEGLQQYGVSTIADLSEADKKALHSWAQKEIELRRTLRLLGETSSTEVAAEDCDCETAPVEERCWDGYEPTPGKKAYEKGSCQKEDEVRTSDLAKTAVQNSWKEEAEEDEEKPEEEEIKEAIAIAPDELAHNKAVGVRDATKAHPVQADVIRDSSPVNGTTEFRMLVQFPTNERCVIVPPPTLPGAPTVSALKEIVEGLPYYCETITRALDAASSAPHNEPNFKGDSDSTKSE